MAVKTHNSYSKSSILILVLLFAFISAQSSFCISASDTIIVDGELVEIEPRKKKVDIDSLDQVLKRDIAIPREKIVVALSALPGADFSRCRWSSNSDSLQNLNLFLGQKAYWKPTFSAAFESSVMLNNQLGVFAGLGWSQLRFGYETLNKATLSADSLRFAFENRSGNLYQYYTYQVGPGFETDTTQVGQMDFSSTINFCDIPLGLRIYPSSYNDKIAFYIDLGGVFRHRMNSVSFANAYLLNDKGRLTEVNLNSAALPKNYFTANIRVGCQGKLNESWRWQAQMMLVNFPETDLNNDALFRVRFSTWRLQLGISRFFTM
jgi:hypothetical protein